MRGYLNGGVLLSRRTFVGASFAQLAMTSRTVRAAANSGFFNGRVVAEWLADGRTMQLVEPFEYVGPDARSWRVPSGATVDGASIPQFFWSLIGGPFEGLYRAPSVVHDFYCDVRTRRSSEVHQAFHDAMLCAGVEPSQAWLMHQAVLRFGPYWPDPDPACDAAREDGSLGSCTGGLSPPDVLWPTQSEEELQRFIDDVSPYVDPWATAEMQSQLEGVFRSMPQQLLEDLEAGRCIEEAPDRFVCP
jgi:hypothetical protein